MSKKIVAVLFLISILFVTEAMAGPFGLEKGMSLKDIGGKPEKVGHGIYKLVPERKPLFSVCRDKILTDFTEG